MKKILLLTLAFFVCSAMKAQMDIELQHLARSKAGTPAYMKAKRLHHMASEQSVVVIAQMQGKYSLPLSKLEQMGVKVRSNYGKIAILSVPVSKLNAVAEMKEIAYLNTDRKCHFQNDSARVHTQVDSLQLEPLYKELGLEMPYDGSGILAGIVDAGIDFQHVAFLDEEGHSRIRMIQEYDTSEGEFPEDMNAIRTTITDPEEIEAHLTKACSMSHGSHTSCIMAGSPVTLSDGLTIQGMAPKAELLLSDMSSKDGETYDSYCMDAIFSQIEYAKQVGKPIVINNSYGEPSAFCDGKSPFNVFEESLAGPGRVLCFSSGNSNNDNSCLEYEFTSDTDTLRTFLFDFHDFYHNGVKAYIISEDSEPFNLKLICYNLISMQENPFSFYSFTDNTPISENEAVIQGNEMIHDNRYTAKIDLPEGYAVDEFFPYFIGLHVSGRKGQHVRMVYPNYSLSSISNPNYTNGNNVNSFSYHCESDSVISVGSYISRKQGKKLDGTFLKSQGEIFQPSVFSSYGQTVYGKKIPDVLAPGEYLLSAINASDSTRVDQKTNELTNKNDYGYSEAFGRRSFYGWMRGTSMSCPVTAGIIALWLQAYPNLSVSEIRDVIEHTSIYPPEVSDIPTEQLGYGYIQAASGLQYIQAKYRTTKTDFPTDISGQTSTTLYNLTGQKVNDHYKGLVIKNRRKVLAY